MRVSNLNTAMHAAKNGLFAIIALMLASCGGGGWGDIPTTVKLNSIEVAPTALTVTSSKTATLRATGIYTDGSTADISSQVEWESAEPATAAVGNNGIVSGAVAGTTRVTAKLHGIRSPQASITVTSYNLSSITITPALTTLAKGAHTTLVAIGAYSDGSSSDISTQVTWTSVSPATATVGASTGTVTGVAVGSAAVNASLNGIISPVANVTVTAAVLNSITITAGATLAKGASTSLTATGTYSDGTTADVTSQVIWSSADPLTATIGANTGSLVGAAVGMTTVNAALNGITSNTASITVMAATLGSITITPASTTLPKGTNVNLSAIGTYSDGSTANLTTQVDWSSVDPAKASVGIHTGVVLASAVGSTGISASLNGVIAPSASVTVTPAVLTSIALTPTSASLAKGTNTGFAATGTYSDGTTPDITTQANWYSAAPATATVGANTGIVVAAAEGTTTVYASLGSITSPTASITVTPKVLTGITVTPASATIAKGGSQSFTATGTYSDSSTGNITGSVAWHSSDTAVAIMNVSGGASGLSVNVANISASLSSITSNIAVLNITAGFRGTVSGLTTGHNIGLSNNGTDNLNIPGLAALLPPIPFTFATRLNHGATYNLSITSMPVGMNCSSLYGTGIVGTDDITNMYVFCGMPYTGQWAPGPMSSNRQQHTLTLLEFPFGVPENGKVLVAGGVGPAALNSWIYDPATGLAAAVPLTNHNRFNHAASSLSSFASPSGGLVLVSGGIPLDVNGNVIVGASPIASSELYMPPNTPPLMSPSASWHDTTYNLNFARSVHTSTLLNNGRVLVAGGLGAAGTAISSAELFFLISPIDGAWMVTGIMSAARYGHTATLLPNGKVLVVGGKDASNVSLASAELYDPATGQWSATGSLSTARYQHTATLLPDGKVLVVAGGGSGVGLSSAELYNPVSGQWVATGSTSYPHEQHTATLLPTGQVLVVGGGIGVYGSLTELFDPATGTWTSTGSLSTGRYAHRSILLPNGKVLLWGGVGTGAKVELYW